MIVTYKDRKVDIEISGAVPDPDYWCDAYIDKAEWQDTGLELTNKEYDKIQEYFSTEAGYEWIMDWLY